MSTDQALAGYRIGITSSRRVSELATMLERQGAVVESAPALMILSCIEDVQLRVATVACIEAPPDFLIANTGVGMRGWFDAAAEWGLGAELVASLQGCEILARGSKAVGAVRAAGLHESWVSSSESLDDILAHLRDRDLTGTRIVLQEHGVSTSACCCCARAPGGGGHRGDGLSLPASGRPGSVVPSRRPRGRPGRRRGGLHRRRSGQGPDGRCRGFGSQAGGSGRAPRSCQRGMRGPGDRGSLWALGDSRDPARPIPSRGPRPGDRGPAAGAVGTVSGSTLAADSS